MEERNIKVCHRLEYKECLLLASFFLIMVFAVVMRTHFNSYEKGHREGYLEGYREGLKDGHNLRINDGKDLVPELVEGTNEGAGR